MKTKEEIFEVIRESLRDVLPELESDRIELSVSMKDLGANSIDRADVIIETMEALDLKFPMHELGALRNIGELVDDLYARGLKASS